MTEQSIKHNILKVRESLNLTQEEMAKMIGLSRQAYINLEHGGTSLVNKWLFRMSEATGVELEVFLLGFDPRERSISQLKDIESYGEKLHLMQEKFNMMERLMDEKEKALNDQRTFSSYLIGLHPKND
ncbi:MAG: helix-turn-helix transcriptional regulator [Candidatus Cryptobacteroides sp.]